VILNRKPNHLICDEGEKGDDYQINDEKTNFRDVRKHSSL